jgi:hypothetical protein
LGERIVNRRREKEGKTCKEIENEKIKKGIEKAKRYCDKT